MPGKREPRGDQEVSNLEPSPSYGPLEAGPCPSLNCEQILEAILYLDPDSDPDAPSECENRTLVRCIAALVALFYLAIFFWLRHCVR